MQPWFEAVTLPEGQSCLVYDRRLPEFGFNWHYHPEYELTLTLGSRGTRFVGSDVAPYAEGDLALVGPNLPHAWQSHDLAEGAAEHRAVICWFTDEWVRGLPTVLPELHLIAPLLTAASGGVLFGPDDAVRADIMALCDLPPAERALRLTAILVALAQHPVQRPLTNTARTPDDMPRDQRRMEAVLGHLHATLDAPIRLGPLCELAHVTESQLQRIFKRSTGLSISAYVTRLRIGRAATLLVRTDLPMTQIATRCGFHDAAHLARKFRETTGRTPSAHRRDFRARSALPPEGVFPMRK
ncbi:AraC family transcriptional regulator [Sagittula sp. NFXS13]|uniref:AraC family transcriptional regulator n=1 Tax=Sagittula sp. NFXS13 TaxID=2819095 RepID=UPI0032DF70D8